ncbi:DUF5681 domain-containing protein [Leptospira levettii]|uniref:DUF5681 domain-containing protein n=2 Tax=Leptospira TaxID=171 RepID=UPI000C2A870A|nr:MULTISPECIES: DUF5681 domain-containing protein [Leptospira]PJZ87922.1 hypothetical protein CH368_14265 [Leptospira levettii]
MSKTPANRKKTGGTAKNSKTTFRKGQSGNPSGRPPLPKDILEMRTASKENLIRAYYKYSTADPDNLPLPENLLEQGVMSAFKEFGKKKGGGRNKNMDLLWDRIMGKPEAKLELNGSLPLPTVTPILVVPDRMDFDEWNKRFNQQS